MVATTLVLNKEQGYGTSCRKVQHLQGFTDGDDGVKSVLVWSWGGGGMWFVLCQCLGKATQGKSVISCSDEAVS